MNPGDPRHPWSRLTRAARTVRDERDTVAPAGFATRVAALALEREFSPISLFERYSWRAVGVAGLLALLSLAANFSALTVPAETEEDELVESPITLLLNVD